MPTVLSEEHSDALPNIDGDPPSNQSPLYALRCLHVDEQRCLKGRDNDGRAVSLESQLDVAGKGKHFVDIQSEQHGQNLFHPELRQTAYDKRM